MDDFCKIFFQSTYTRVDLYALIYGNCAAARIENNFKIKITIKLFLQITHQLRMRQIALKAKNVLKKKHLCRGLPGSKKLKGRIWPLAVSKRLNP